MAISPQIAAFLDFALKPLAFAVRLREAHGVATLTGLSGLTPG
jgi:hypothetical protein